MFCRKLAHIVCLTLFLVGCAAPPAPRAAPVVFSVLYNDRKATPFRKDWLILDEYRKRQNVVLDVRLGDDADYDRAVAQVIDSGDVPDIILKVWPKTIESYANRGLLLPFSDYENQMPHFMSYIREHQLQGELDKLRLSNGKYYILPGYQRQIQVQQWMYRRDIFNKHGLPAPGTYDEMFNSLVTLKSIYTDSTPITTPWAGAHLFAMMGAAYGIPAGWAGASSYNAEENRWQFSPATDNYKALFTFLHRCYAAGILDTAIFTQTDAQTYEKFGNGRALVSVTWITSGFGPWNAKLKQNGYPDGEWAPLPVPASTIGMKALPAVDPFRKGLVVSSRVVNQPYFKDLLRFLDWAVYSDEGMTLTAWGVEGLTYETTPDGKAFPANIKTSRNPSGTVEMGKDYGFDLLFNLNENAELEDYKKPADIVAFLQKSLEAKEAAGVSPPLKLDTQSIEAIRAISGKLDPYVTDASRKFITGELDIARDWKAYLSQLEKMGYKTVERIWNDAWKKQNQ